ncbi:TPA: type II toxin-antitoxin system RelE/ParE family toxin [Escherichia coli]|nr:type II toxin-antitoxin system RelE/ParE family toxin [Escherichia coli]EHR8739140.1 type II toxin-antitoxin system RelE/ParE family toxin [Escherichia coli]EIP3248799.1 type II toxin-antitoxin system RelE/ParE family toxin [Escherichia coli]EJV7471136.1 type II toxin-antitoxin system RelE/ParE family toxin [Escherichia coli]EJV7474482.1 type II toxin-antitoxin system RelE/ParE family toxin [Escherichia coli]
MAYFLDFDERALKEWRKLGSTVREQLKKKLVEVLESPRIEANKLRGMPDCYKIKLRSRTDLSCAKVSLSLHYRH